MVPRSFLAALLPVAFLFDLTGGKKEAFSHCVSDDKHSFYKFQDKTLLGKAVKLSKYNGSIVLLINVATF